MRFFSVQTAFAESAAVAGRSGKGFTQMNKYLKVIKPWITYIAAIIMLIGVSMFILSVHDDNPNLKTKALLLIAAGGIIQSVIAAVTVANLAW